MSDATWQEWTRRFALFHADVLRQSAAGGGRHLYNLRGNLRYGLTVDLDLLGASPEAAVESDVLTLDLRERAHASLFDEEPDETDLAVDPEESEGLFDESGVVEADIALGADRSRAAAAARRIYLKQKADPYNRETTIGYPLIGGRSGRREVAGPLLYWTINLDYDPRQQTLALIRPVVTPVLNTVLLSKFSGDATELDLVREELLPLLLSDDFDLASVDRILETLRGIFVPLRSMNSCSAAGPPLSNFLTAIRDLRPGDSAVWSDSSVMVNGSRTYAFIIDDLKRIAKLSEIAGTTVLPRVLARPRETGLGEESVGALPFQDTGEGGRSFWFPEKSNVAQRRAAARASRATLLTIQGPPGTGKSQTIANMVCDFVAEGKSVLVTSHTIKALEVVANKLPRVDQLAVSVLRGDKESLARLRTELESVQESRQESPSQLAGAVEQAENRLVELDRELRSLERRYSELSQLEHEEYSGHSRYSEIRGFDDIEPDDNPDPGDPDELADLLVEYARIARDLGPVLDRFERVYRPAGSSQPRVLDDKIQECLLDLLGYARSARKEVDEAGLIKAESLRDERCERAAVLAELREWEGWLHGEARRFLTQMEAVSTAGSQSDARAVRSLLAAYRSIGKEAVGRMQKRCETYSAFFSASAVRGTEAPWLAPTERPAVADALTTLAETRGSFFRWGLSRSRRAAQEVLREAHWPDVERNRVREQVSRARGYLAWQEEASAARELFRELDAALPSFLVRQVPEQYDTAALATAAESRLRALTLLRQSASNPLLETASPVLVPIALEWADRLSSGTRESLAHSCAAALRRLREVWGTAETMSALTELGVPEDAVSALVDSIRERSAKGEACEAERKLSTLTASYPVYRRMVDIESAQLSTLRGTLGRVRAEMSADPEIPAWLQTAENARTAIEAHRLSSLLRQSLKANPDDLTEIAAALSKGQTERLQVILEVVTRRRKRDVARAIDAPSTRSSLLKMRELLGRKKKTALLVALRDKIDYTDVLKVFPCWICSIEDVARLFPLVPGLFDVLIIDEASQCDQSTLLPMAVRAKRAVVVGDRKQLNPAGARFLNVANLSLLQERHRISEHHHSMFLDGRKSLLEVVEACSDGQEFLDEHFRCEPEIIRWSNRRHYNDRLRILTPRRKDRFTAPLKVVHVRDADDDGERKVNEIEARQVVRAVREMVSNGAAEGRLSLGILSPYRRQADLLNELLYEEFRDNPELLEHHKIVASTADGFQGDERDIILYSFRYGPSSHPAVVTSIQREEERLNVAFTRAKLLGICFVSQTLDRFPHGPIRDFLEHAQAVENEGLSRAARPDQFESGFEEAVCEALRARGLVVSTQEPCAGFRIDLVVEDRDGRVLGVECDGEWKLDALGHLRPEDYQRQDILERAGWSIHRISGRSWSLHPDGEVDKVVELLDLQPTADERDLSFGPQSREVLEASPGYEPEEVEPQEQPEPEVIGAGHEDEFVEDLGGEEEPAAHGTQFVLGLEWLGTSWDEQVLMIKRLWRWWLLDGSLERSAIDALGDIEQAVEEHKSLPPESRTYLQGLFFTALARGFNPEAKDELPPPRPRVDAAAPTLASIGPSHDVTDILPALERFDPVPRAVLERLIEVYPRCQTKYELSGNLVARQGLKPREAESELIEGLLEGVLSDLVSSDGKSPKCWKLDLGQVREET